MTASEPAIGQVHPDILDQTALNGGFVQIASKTVQQDFRINRRPAARMPVALLHGLAYESEVNVSVDEP